MTADAPPEARRALLRALEQFNTWRFYDCHETLEDVWLETGGKTDGTPLTAFYHGLIKAAAGFHHVLRNNHKGAVTLLADALRLLSPYAPTTLTVDVRSLTEDLRTSLDRLMELGPERLPDFDRSSIPQITYDTDALAK
jgi:predicted metal-dependent hydrolase